MPVWIGFISVIVIYLALQNRRQDKDLQKLIRDEEEAAQAVEWTKRYLKNGV